MGDVDARRVHERARRHEGVRSGVVGLVGFLVMAAVVTGAIVGIDRWRARDDDGAPTAQVDDERLQPEREVQELTDEVERDPTAVSEAGGDAVRVDAGGGLSWTMAVAPEEQAVREPALDGSLVEGRLWTGDLSEGEGDLVVVVDLQGHTMDPDLGLDPVITGAGGRLVSGPSPITVAGRQGRMVVAVTEDGLGGRSWSRVASVEIDDRLLILASVRAYDEARAEQAFADLVASVSAR